MDIRIKRLNMLKNQLDQYKTIDTDLDTSVDQIKAPITNYSQLRAQMLSEHVQSGYAFNDSSFNNVEVYAEYNNGKGLNFHIYPLITTVSESKTEDLELHRESDDKKKLAVIKKS